MNVVRASSWTELQEQLFEGSWNPDIQRFRPKAAYRGLSSSDYRLETTLQRMRGSYVLVERHLLRNFKKYAHRSVVSQDSTWHWIAVGKHYGLPTRLLDWTHSPFVAMHFATSNIEKMHEDGVIWVVDYARAHDLLPMDLQEQLRSEGATIFTTELLAKSLRGLDELAALAGDFVVFFEPPSIDDRIVNQFALFSLLPDPRTTFDTWLEKHPEVWRKIVIPAALKWEIRDKLDQANITERVLFPGMDGLSRWLKRQYSPKGDDLGV
jgi:hypothetical protein